MKKVLFLTLTMSSLASAASPWLSMASKRAPKAFGLLVGHGLAVAGIKKLEQKVARNIYNHTANGLGIMLGSMLNKNDAQDEQANRWVNQMRWRAYGLLALDRLKRITLMRGVGVTAGHLSNNKLVGSIGRWVPFVAAPTSVGLYAISSLPGCDWITEKVINNQYVESALWGLAAGCIALNKSTK